MYQKIRKQNQGFTIIEVLIVLAIAGLILLIVFLAVPALQRNSRNTQRKEDAAKALAAVVEWSNNNNGVMPTTGVQQGEALANANLGIFNGVTTWGVAAAWPGTPNNLVLAVNNKCSGETALTAQNRSVAAMYMVETGGASVRQCEES